MTIQSTIRSIALSLLALSVSFPNHATAQSDFVPVGDNRNENHDAALRSAKSIDDESQVAMLNNGGGCAPSKSGPIAVSADGSCAGSLSASDFAHAVRAKYPSGKIDPNSSYMFKVDGVTYRTSTYGSYLRREDPRSLNETKVGLDLKPIVEEKGTVASAEAAPAAITETAPSPMPSTEVAEAPAPAPSAAPKPKVAMSVAPVSPQNLNSGNDSEYSHRSAYAATSNPMWDMMNMTNEEVAAEKQQKIDASIRQQQERTFAAHELVHATNASYVNPYSAPGVLKKEPSPLMQHYMQPVNFQQAGNGSMLKK